jgi:hypothetical protein
MTYKISNSQAARELLNDPRATPIERRGALIALNLQTPRRERDYEIIQQWTAK